ncbi:uncharacterized protein LOC143892273 [Tasmannia lanceolata]|uniref:uncharacterized protein LOC143892273 n=1 Tax=Tasmannia lanceolata TaxID=3420 RepID=UPI004063C77D
MANVTRSCRKLKDDDKNVSKRKTIGVKAKAAKVSTISSSAMTDTSGLRRSSRETASKKREISSKKQSSSSSPLSIQKSDRLEKQTPLAPSVKRKLDCIEKQSMPSPLRRSERASKHRLLNSSGSKKSEKGSGSLDAKMKNEKREKSGKRVAVDKSSSGSKKSEKGSGSLDAKRKNENKEKNGKQMPVETRDWSKSKKRCRKGATLTLKKNKRRRKTISMRHANKVKEADISEMQRRKDNLSQCDSDNTDSNGSKQVEEGVDECSGKKGDSREKYLEQVGQEAVEGSSSGSRKHADVNLSNSDGEIDLGLSSRKRKSCSEEVHESNNGVSSPVSKDSDSAFQLSPVKLKGKETVDDADRAEVGCLAREDLSTAELKLSTSSEGKSLAVDMERTGDVAVFKRKRNGTGPDSDISVTGVTKSTCILETSSPDVISSSPTHKRSRCIETCDSCFKPRLDSDSPNQVCSCNAKTSQDLCEMLLSEVMDVRPNNFTYCSRHPKSSEEDRESHGKECSNSAQSKDSSLENQMDSDHNACIKCKLGGKLLCCDGKGCRRSYHLTCLDPPLKDVPPGVWYCLWCAKKKIECGVHSVSEGVESIWDLREAEVSDHKGVQKEKQYLVKYRGLAHVHNRWVPENQLLHEAPTLIAKFNRRHQRDKALTWKLEWTLPQRLLQKRLLISPRQADKYFVGHCGDFTNCRYEWFVKWNGLGNEHATWELENASFLSSPEAMKLISDFESRCRKAKERSDPSTVDKVLQERKVSLPKLSKLPGGHSPGLDNDHLSSVNKLREYWHKCQNAVVIDDQERIMKVILFILSLQSHVCRPFLIISTSSALPVWEAEFLRLAPSVNVVVYNGDRDARKSIRALEFYEEGGCVMFQVLLSFHDAITEDIESLNCLGWEAIIVDECHRSRISKHFEQIRLFTCDFRLLLVNGPVKDNIPEYINLLSLLDSGKEGIDSDGLKNESNDSIGTLAVLKEKFAQYLAYEPKSDSKFLEYWVPVQLSYVQLEQYCSTLLSNSISLRSCSKNDPVGALRDILISTRKCCDHPYLVDESLQGTLTKGLPEHEYLDVGVNAGGKLQLLDKILPEIKKRGLRVLILFQSIGGSGRNSIGDILDDFLRQRFGPDSYERVDSGLVSAKKQTALNMFNNREKGRFVFLIENRACLPSIKLSGVDSIIIFDSDWNPLNDLRALQRINVDSPLEHLKVFRLYSSCTVEEKVLICAKQEMTLDSNIQNISCSISHMLLTWGASYLFNKLDEFHGHNSPSIGSKISYEQPLLNDTVLELLTQLPREVEADSINTSNCSVIMKVQNSGVAYPRNAYLHGEMEMLLTDEDVPHVFWTKLLDGRFPRWRYLSGSSQRARKKVQYFGDSAKKPEEENDQVGKKHKKGVNNTVDPSSLKARQEDKGKEATMDGKAKIADAATFPYSSCVSSHISPSKDPLFSDTVKEPGAFGILDDSVSQHLPCSMADIKDLTNATDNPPKPHNVSGLHAVHMDEFEGRENIRDAQKSLHIFLKPLISTLCETLQFPEDVKHMAGKLLEYIMNNHRVSREPEAILQAFQISLCWVAASLMKHKVDWKETLQLAKQHLSFECKEEEAKSVYSMLRKLKKRFSCQTGTSGNATGSISQDGQSSAPRNKDVASHLLLERTVGPTGSEQQGLKGGTRETSPRHNSSEQRVLVEPEPDREEINGMAHMQHTTVQPPSHLFDGSGPQNNEFISHCSRRLERVCAKRTKKLLLRQQEEAREFHKYREKTIAKLKEAHRLESNLIRSTHINLLDRLEKLKQLDENFECKLNELYRHLENSQRKLMAIQLDVRNKEKRLGARWMEEAKRGRLVDRFRKYLFRESTLPGGTPAEVPGGVLNDAVVDPPMRNSRMVVVSNENDGMDNAALEGATIAGNNWHSWEENSHGPDYMGNGQNDSDSPHQVPSINCNPPLISAEARSEHVPSYEGQSSQQMEVPILLPADATSAQNELCNGIHSSGVPSVEHFQPGASIVMGSEHEQSSTNPNSIQQTVVATQQPVETLVSQVEQSNHSVIPSQVGQSNCNPPLMSAEARSEHVPSYEGQSSQQMEVPILLPADATSAQNELCNGIHSSGVPSVEHFQPDASIVMGSEHEQTSTNLNSIQQTVVATQQPVETLISQVEQSNHSAIPSQVGQSNHFSSQLIMQPQLPLYTDMSVEVTPIEDPGNTGILPELSSRAPQYPMTAPRPPQFKLDPLQYEMAKIHREKELTVKMHEDEKIRLKSECEREIEEVHRKYNGLIQDAESRFVQRQKILETNLNKACLNRILAEAFKYKFTDPRPAARKGLPSTSVHHSQQPLPQAFPQTVHRPARAPAPVTAPTQLVEAVHHSSALFSCNYPTPQFNPTIPPHINLQVSAEQRAPAPHLQPFRTMASTSAPSHPPPPVVMQSQQSVTNNSSKSTPLGGVSGTNSQPSSCALPLSPSSSLSTQELLMDIESHVEPYRSTLGSIFDTRVPSALVPEGNPRVPPVSNIARVPAEVEVVCLSDEDN